MVYIFSIDSVSLIDDGQVLQVLDVFCKIIRFHRSLDIGSVKEGLC